ncbi:hypothetical protein Gbro_1444 [Gordonia bronchialis DSM 43247]|uniref:Uncharacterized protein n=1 Tax=Gordonia bronchialis (strain ATCC 25592 / DSM 43247 / BCRC 13721 / JCM 3198 / KCTC 3076 / NBRC 16047 / NCTC 10667) TaxID=526226 RepID=D0L6G8_GORB4|nr:hypothetical protein Gbro_1444 [Gordonia bronchialis DSM 43247]STQ63556.1 Uncharacterised protein [Gordonia bronchialis]
MTDRSVRMTVDHVRRQLSRYTVDTTVDESSDPRLRQSIEWLISSQLPSGGFGNNSAAYTAIAVKAIRSWQPGWSQSDGFERAARHVIASSSNGKLETVWDTAVAANALAGSAYTDTWVDQATDYLSQLVPDPHLKPHHIAQLLITVTARRPDSNSIPEWVSILRTQRIYPATPYCLGQVSSALVAAPEANIDLRLQCDELGAWLGSVDVTKANFVEYCSALVGLSASTHPTHSARVSACVDDLFSDGRRLDGSWYHDAWETSWALLALKLASARKLVTLSVHDLALILEDADKLADNLQESYRNRFSVLNPSYFWNVVAYSQVLLILVALAVYGIFLSQDSGWYIGFVSLLLVPGLGTVRQLWHLRSMTLNQDN